MNRTRTLMRAGTVIGLVLIVGLVMARPGSASPLAQNLSEPTARPSPTAAPHIVLNPVQAIANQDLTITVTGRQWPGGGPDVVLDWDAPGTGHRLAGPFAVKANGTFEVSVLVPAEWAIPGEHWIVASDNYGLVASASLHLIAPTPTNTPTPTATFTPTGTPTPTQTPTPAPPTATHTPTHTPTPITPTPALRTVTPIVTETPTPPPAKQPVRSATKTPAPTKTPEPTSTPTESTPTPTATESPTPRPSSTPIAAPTTTPTFTPTSSPTATPSPTHTSTPTLTPVPGTPTAASIAMAVDPSAPGTQLPATDTSWQPDFLEGFIAAILLIVLTMAFLTVVLLTLLAVLQLRRMRQARQES